MGDDVICIDSDDDDEDDASNVGRTLGTRASAGRRWSGGRGYWQQRRKALRERKKLNLQTFCRPLAGLLDGLRRLSSELSPGGIPNHSVAQRVHRLVTEFGGHLMPESDRQEGWRQVLRFLLVHRASGGFESADGGAEGQENDPTRRNKRRQSCYRYQLTVIDILVDYIRFRCETLTARQPPTAPSVLLHECNRIVANLFAIFDGSVEPVTLTLLRTPPEPRYTMLLYPVFEAILTDRSVRRCGGTVGTIPSYVRMLLCFKRWRSLAIGRTDKAVIDAQAGHFLPARCPTILTASDVPLLRLLPSVPAAQRVNETRYLMANDLFSLDRCVAQFFRHHRRMSPVAADERQLSGIAPRPATTMANRLTALEVSSNYINASLMAELIERKGQLWARAFPAPAPCLLQEAHSIVESLRMIFCRRTEFIELTLLQVPASSEHAPLLAPIFAAFLATPADPGLTGSAPNTTPTGLTIYRSNDVETYARLILCYAKWKALYRMSTREDDGAPEPTEWTHIDTIALSQLPFDFPRALCARDARLRKVFPSLLRSGPGTVGAEVRGSNHMVTWFLLLTLPKRADLQELCLKFIEAYRSGLQKAEAEPQPIRIPGKDPMTCSAAYKSMSASIDRTDRKQPSEDDGTATSGQPTLRTEMKPIIIPDSDDGDEMSASDSILSVSSSTVLVHSRQAALCPVAVSGSPETTREPDRNPSSTPTTPIPWPPFTVECLFNTPPATPQQEVIAESEEDHRGGRCLTVKKPPLPSWCRLKGTVRSIERGGKKLTNVGSVTLRRTLRRLFNGGVGVGGWWSFADILAVQVPFARNVRWRSSIINVPTIPVDGCATDTRRTASFNSHELLSDRSEVVVRDSPPSDATLLQLINCLEAGDGSLSFDSTQACVDFVIPFDNPGRTDVGHPSAMNDQASPSAFGPPVDTSPLFASGSDRFVHLVTELGPVSWPIV